MTRLRIAVALAVLAVAGGSAAPASAHDVTLTGTDMDIGVLDYNGFVWTVQVKARVSCSGANVSELGVTLEQIRSYSQIGGGAVLASPPPNTYEVRSVMLPPGQYHVRFGVAVCRSTEETPDGHEGDHGEANTNPISTYLNLPNCRTNEGTGSRVALRAPLVPVVGTPRDMRAPCPARLCNVLGSASGRLPLVPVGPGPAVPAPCPTIAISRPNVPVDVVCGPGSVAARRSPLLPVPSAPCRGSVELVSVSAGVANASASRVVGVKRFKIRRGTSRAVRVPLTRAARRTLNLTRVLRVRAVVRTKGKLRKSKPFTIFKR